MRPLLSILLLPMAAALCLNSCGTYDMTAKHVGTSPHCKVHGVKMHPETMRTSPASIHYDAERLSAILKDFPNHGTVWMEGEEGNLMFNRHVRAFVCPVCQKNYVRFVERSRQLHAGNGVNVR